MKYVGIGTILAILGVGLSTLIWGTEKAYLLSAIFGGIFLVFSMLMSGSLGSGDRIRANLATESKADRNQRNHLMKSAFLLALPNIMAAVLAYYLWC